MHDTDHTQHSRRRVLRCMTMGTAGLLWTVRGGVPGLVSEAEAATGPLTFAQISDTHIGFAKDPNTNPAGTLSDALGRLAAQKPAFLLHTGDVSHLSKAAEFETAASLIQTTGLQTHYVPGEHDVIDDDGVAFFQRFGKPNGTGGWYSFDAGGVHFIGLVNVLNLRPGGLGNLGADQIAWLRDDLHRKSASQPIVVFAHMPLWALYPQWGWGTDDAAAALDLLKRFGSVTVLNGHIHQVLQKVEGHVTFQTARSTAFPQATPGEGPGPGPLNVPAEKLKSMLGVREVVVTRGRAAINDQSLEG